MTDDITRQLLRLLPPDGDADPRELLRRVTREHLESLAPAIADATLRAAIVHTFDVDTMRALLPASEGDQTAVATSMFNAIRALPFVEDLTEGRYAVHSETRSILLDWFWSEDRDSFRTVSDQARTYFGREFLKGEDSTVNDVVEFIYHDLVVDEEGALDYAIQIFGQLNDARQSGMAHALVTAVAEQAEAGRVSTRAAWVSRYLAAELLMTQGQHSNASQRAAELVDSATDLIPEWLVARAARIAGTSHAWMGSYDEAIHWYEKAAEREEATPEAIATQHLDIAWIQHLRGRFGEATSAVEKAIAALVPSLLVPMPQSAFPSAIPVYRAESPPEADMQRDDEHSPGWDDSEPLFLPNEVFALNPDAWSYADGQMYVATTRSAVSSPESSTNGDDDGSVFWPINVTAQLGAAWRMRGSIAFDADDFGIAETGARLGGQIASQLDDGPSVVAASQLIYLVGGTTGDLELSDFAIDTMKASVDAARERGDLGVEIEGLLWLGNAFVEKPDLAAAEDNYQRAINVANEAQDVVNVARAHHGLASIAAANRDYTLAAQEYATAIHILHDANIRDDAARYMLDAGAVALARHRHSEAEQHYGEALRIFRELGLRSGEFSALMALAYLARDRHRDDVARSRYREAVERARRSGAPSQEIEGLAGLGSFEAERGHPREAEQHLNSALEIARRIGSRGQEAGTLELLGTAARIRRDWPAAISTLKAAREAYRALAKPVRELGAIQSLIRVYSHSDNEELAVETANEALEMARSTGSREAERGIQFELAYALSNVGRHRESIRIMEQAVDEDPEDPVAQVALGWILFQADDWERSISCSRRALELDPTQNDAVRNLGHASLALGRTEEARSWYQRAVENRHEGEDFAEEVEAIRRLIERHPETPNATEFLTYLDEIDHALVE